MFLADWMKIRGRNEDLFDGLEWLGEQGYVEQKEGKIPDAIFLTDSVFTNI